jgi:uncharacterized protein YutE (UPF0331/DUF86 family)
MNKRLQQLENNVAELQRIKKQYTVEEIQDDKTKEWALRYGLLESIQIVIDISCHLVVHKNLGNADTYSECIELLQRFDYIDKDLEKNLKGMTGLRNILVHEYVDINIKQLYETLDNLDDFNRFSR